MTKRKKVWIIVGILVPILVITIFYIQGDILYRLDRVNDGLAHPEFPYRDYTVEELGKLYPQYADYSDIKTTQTPEETHAIFMEHLKKDEIEGAVECCFRKGDWNEKKEFINGVKEKGLLDAMISDLSVIEGEYKEERNRASYAFDGIYRGVTIKNSIDFLKTSEGVWLIESL